MYDTALIDIGTVGHQLWRNWPGEESYMKMEDYILHAVEAYDHVPFIRGVKSHIWIGDGKPYFRKLLFQSYKSNRPPRETEQRLFLEMFNEVVNSLRVTHFEADDLIRAYCDMYGELEKIVICTVDSDLLQLLSNNVTWCCTHGFYPQVRNIHDGSLPTWMGNKFKKLSKKRIGHLDLNDPQSIIEWKVEYGDSSDNIPAGEESRWLIDLRNPPEDWDIMDIDGLDKMFEDHRMTTKNDRPKCQVYLDYNLKTGKKLPTSWSGK